MKLLAFLTFLSLPVLGGSISLNFEGGDNNPASANLLAPSDIAGVVPVPNWNNASGASGSQSNLIDDSGSATTADVTWTGQATWSWEQSNDPVPANPNGTMFNGYLDTVGNNGSHIISVIDIPYSQYDVIVYIDGENNGGDRPARININPGSTGDNPALDVFTRENANWNGTFVQATATNLPGTSGANYARFNGLTDSNFGIYAEAESFRAAINGFQIIETAVAPGLPEIANLTPTAITSSSASARADLIDNGDGADSAAVTFYWGTADGGTSTVAWQSSISAGNFTTPTSPVTANLGSLQANTTYFYRSFVSNSAGSDWANDTESFTTPAALPVVTNSAASNVQALSATVGGDVSSTGGDAPTIRLFYGDNDGGATEGNWDFFVDLGTQSGSFSTVLSSLTQNATYYYTSRATNSAGSSWPASSSSFTTTSLSLPSVATQQASNLTGTTARLNGTVTNTGGDPPSVGFYYGKTDGGIVAGNWDLFVQIGVESNDFSRTVSNLDPLSTYYFRSVATNSAGTAWAGNSLSFITPAYVPPTVVINELHIDEDNKTRKGEFIELFNNSDDPIDVSGWYFSNGINQAGNPSADFTIPGGTIIAGKDYLVIAQDPSEVQSLFGYSGALGPWEGKLSNKGEKVTLNDSGGNEIDEVDYGTGWPWPTVGDPPSPSLELINPNLDNNLGGSWRSSGNVPPGGGSSSNPTPGAVNSTFVLNAPPAMRQVAHTPEQPNSAVPVTITNKVTDTDGVASVTLEYQLVDPGSYIKLSDPLYSTSWTSVPMLDDGTNGDLLAGDDIYTVVLPDTLQTHRRLVRYRITAVDNPGATVTGPYSDDDQPNFAYFVYDSLPIWSAKATTSSSNVNYDFNALPDLQQNVPVYHLITTREEHEQSQYIPNSSSGTYGGSDYLWEGTLVYEGQIYDHIRFRARGGVWRYAMGKNMWKFDFNRGRRFKARDNYGRRYDADWSKLNFSALIQQGNFNQRGEQGLFEWGGFKLHNLTGNPAPETHFVHFRIISDANENGPTASQFDTDFQGLYLAVEQMDGQFLEQHDLEDGNLYKMEGGTGELNNQGPDQPSNKSDLNAFFAYKSSAQTQQWWEDNLNLADYYNFRAISTAIHDYDIHAGKNYFYFHDPADDRWRVLNWDLDLTWTTTYNGGGGTGPLSNDVLAIADFKRDYQNRMREILSLLFNDDQTGKILDECARFIHTPGMVSLADADRAMWDYNPILTSPYINGSKAGHGRYYQAASPQTFAGMIDHVKDHIADQTANPIKSSSNHLSGEDSIIPAKPTISYVGGAGFPSNDLVFQSTAFSDPQGSGTFDGMQWRIGEVYHEGITGYIAGDPYRYEIEEVWTSAILPAFAATQTIPIIHARPGRTYRARVRHLDSSGNWGYWSDPVEFTVTDPDVTFFQQNIVVSEFMYHPADASAAEEALGFSNSDFEWIELRNVGAQGIDMTSIRFTKGVDFDFPDSYIIPAGGYVIVARNQAAFEHRYGNTHPIVGEYGPDKLSNGGENLKLSFGAGTSIIEFVYDDNLPWPVPADGDGFSLVLIDPESTPDHSNPSNWRISSQTDGNPGIDDSSTFDDWKLATGVTGGPGGDDDLDGSLNLIEYASGSDGTDPNSKNFPIVSMQTIDGENYLTILFQKRIDADDLIYEVEYSEDLVNWEPLDGVFVSSTPNSNGTSSEVWRSLQAQSVRDNNYVRLKISQIP